MLLSQKLAGFTKGDADTLRKAMGKKQIEVLNKMKGKFMDGATSKGLSSKRLEKVWSDWEAFASYAFNKSHSTCYAFVAYQTAYLKTYYPAEYMAAVLTSCLGNIEKITFFMEECKRMNLPILGPDVNESQRAFSVNKKGELRFGLGGIKGAGDAAVESIISERNEGGHFEDLYEFMRRVNLRTVNKKTLESLAYAGALDGFGLHRAQFFDLIDGENQNFLEKLTKYAGNFHADKQSAQSSLFGLMGGESIMVPKPKAPILEAWGDIQRLKYEQEVVGFFISGHPLDTFRLEMDNFCTCGLNRVLFTDEEMPKPEFLNQEIKIGGIVTAVQQRVSKNGNPFVIFKMEDYSGSLELLLGGQDYVNFSNYLEVGRFLYIRGKVQGKWQRADEFEFRPVQIQLLSDIREKLCKEIRIQTDVQHIDEMWVAEFDNLLKKYPGGISLFLQIVDNQEKMDVRMLSRNYKISPTNEFIADLKNFEGLSWRLN